MPHIIFEHSANLIDIDYKNMFADIYQKMKDIPNIGTCKIRAISQEKYFIGTENGENAFAFLRILMAPKAERTDRFKKNIANKLIPILTKYLKPVKDKLDIKCYPTLEVGTLSKHYFWIEE